MLAAHSIGIEVKEKLGGKVSRLDYFVREGDTLPAKGQKKFRAGRKIRAGSKDSINFKIFQGEIEDRVEDNLFIGALKISGYDFEFGTIFEGAEIICDYTIDDAGSIKLEAEIPAINESFYGNFYSREEAQLNFDKAAGKLNSDGKNLLGQVRELGRAVEDDDDYEKLQQAGEVASAAINANRDCDREELKHIEEDLQAAKKILADIRTRNRESIRREDLDGWRGYYLKHVKKFAKPQENSQLENLFGRAENLIEREDSAYEDTLKEIRGLCWRIIFYRDDEFVVYRFNKLTKNPNDYSDQANFNRLKQAGEEAIAQKNFDKLRDIFWDILDLGGHTQDEFLTANIIKG